MIVVLMGVSGSGKTTIGKELAARLGWTFVEGDDFHPAANVEKMAAGSPLNDEDRRPWLQGLGDRAAEACDRGESVILACSALKQEHRERLERDAQGCVRFVYLTGSEELIRDRLEKREGHFMDPALLHSQFAALEPPVGAVQVDVAPAPEAIAAEIRQKLNL
jgi:gluconokinase